MYGQDQMYSGNVFIPESVDPAPGGIKGHSAFDDEPPLLEVSLDVFGPIRIGRI